jgi:transcriptional regulator with XRE-family HTH domain
MSRNPASGLALRLARLARRMTQQQMADRLGVCTRTIKDWEKKGLPQHGLAKTRNVRMIIETGESDGPMP